MQEVFIKTEYITLGQFLKYLGIIYSGAHAKAYLEENIVLVNLEHEARRGRKLYPNTTIKVNNMEYIIAVDNNV